MQDKMAKIVLNLILGFTYNIFYNNIYKFLIYSKKSIQHQIFLILNIHL